MPSCFRRLFECFHGSRNRDHVANRDKRGLKVPMETESMWVFDNYWDAVMLKLRILTPLFPCNRSNVKIWYWDVLAPPRGQKCISSHLWLQISTLFNHITLFLTNLRICLSHKCFPKFKFSI